MRRVRISHRMTSVHLDVSMVHVSPVVVRLGLSVVFVLERSRGRRGNPFVIPGDCRGLTVHGSEMTVGWVPSYVVRFITFLSPWGTFVRVRVISVARSANWTKVI